MWDEVRGRKVDAFITSERQELAVMLLRNKATGSAPAGGVAPAIGRRVRDAGDPGHLVVAAEFGDDRLGRFHALNF